MFEKLTSDVPASPDHNFVSANPNQFDHAPKLYLLTSFKEMGLIASPRDPNLVRELFHSLPAQEYIEKVSIYKESGSLDIDASSQRLGIPIIINKNLLGHGKITGLTPEDYGLPLEIHLNPTHDSMPLTFGHEVAHFYWSKGLSNQYVEYEQYKEDFCDYFGAQMAMPEKSLPNLSNITESTLLSLAERYELSINDVILQLQEYGFLPPRVAIDSFMPKYPNPDFSEKVARNIVCRHCHDSGGDPNCHLARTVAPLFDFTDMSWGDKFGHCSGEDLLKPEIISTLTSHYRAIGRLAVSEPI